MSIFDTLAQKPWLPSQEKKDNLHTGGPLNSTPQELR